MTVGENIKRIRKKKGLTQKKVGELCNPPISESNIRKYENGKQNAKLETLRRISTALNVPLYELQPDWRTFTREEILKDFTSEEYQKEDALKDLFFKLNEKGKDRAIDQVELLTKIPEYQAHISEPDVVIMKIDKDGNFTES